MIFGTYMYSDKTRCVSETCL